MTAQINDICFHRKIAFKIAGISGSGLFDPTSIGIKGELPSTASNCWRGFVAQYAISDNVLVLTGLQIQLPEDYVNSHSNGNSGPDIFGTQPSSKDDRCYLYEDIHSPVPFTGGLLLGHDLHEPLWVNMGFQPAWKYEHVRHVRFKDGRVIADFDRSEEMLHIRVRMMKDNVQAGRHYRGDAGPNDDITAWIDRCFSRAYQIPDDVATKWDQELEDNSKRRNNGQPPPVASNEDTKLLHNLFADKIGGAMNTRKADNLFQLRFTAVTFIVGCIIGWMKGGWPTGGMLGAAAGLLVGAFLSGFILMVVGLFRRL